MRGNKESKTSGNGLRNPGWHFLVTLRQWDSGQNGTAAVTLVLSQYPRSQLLVVKAVQSRGRQIGADTHKLSW